VVNLEKRLLEREVKRLLKREVKRQLEGETENIK